MAFGPGKYDDLCTMVREKTEADGVVLIVLGGNKGQGFCVQSRGAPLLALPDMLESMARQIRADLGESGPPQ